MVNNFDPKKQKYIVNSLINAEVMPFPIFWQLCAGLQP